MGSQHKHSLYSSGYHVCLQSKRGCFTAAAIHGTVTYDGWHRSQPRMRSPSRKAAAKNAATGRRPPCEQRLGFAMTGSAEMKAPFKLLILAAPLLWTSPAVASDKDWDRASSIGRDLLVGAAIGVPVVQGDWRGALEAGGGMAVAGGTTFVLKDLIHERRPDGSDGRSFPSGHTSVSFAAAATLDKRYGWKAGLPALVMATLVGFARVQADKHYVQDVLAGAVIGSASGLFLTSKRNDRVQLVPWAGYRSGGVSFAARF
jgi:membrane-associated phospholipid phosphatase